MIDQIIIDEIASYDNFSASIAKRKINQPKKKSIKESVPLSNVTYDFSAINGELYWEERELEYIFEINADNPETLEQLKTNFASWVMNIQEQKIHDPFIPNYHFIATYDDMDFDDDESVEKTTATVKFKAYPYKISNSQKLVNFTVDADSQATGIINNNSSHIITPTITTDKAITLLIGDISYSIGAGTTYDEIIKLVVGDNNITIQNTDTENKATVAISFYEEVF